jgi:1-acyl-sn-glycerol-3-phosphate acyltransferase
MGTSLRDDLELFAKGWRWGKRPLAPETARPSQPRLEPKEYPTAWARTKPAKAARRFIQAGLLKPVVWNETDVKVEGLDVLESLKPPVLFVSNHSSHLDAPLILCSLPPAWRERTAVGAAADYFFDVWWRAASTALVFNAFPIERQGSGRGTSTARKMIHEGWNIVVFPEGTRSKDGWVQRFRHGTARLAEETGVPIVPVAIRGAYAAMPRGRSWPRKGRFPITIRYGEPIVPSPDEDFRSVAGRVMQAVARLWDEDRTDWYRSLRREAEGLTPSPSGPTAARWRRIWESSRPLPNRRKRRAWLATGATKALDGT